MSDALLYELLALAAEDPEQLVARLVAVASIHRRYTIDECFECGDAWPCDTTTIITQGAGQ